MLRLLPPLILCILAWSCRNELPTQPQDRAIAAAEAPGTDPCAGLSFSRRTHRICGLIGALRDARFLDIPETTASNEVLFRYFESSANEAGAAALLDAIEYGYGIEAVIANGAALPSTGPRGDVADLQRGWSLVERISSVLEIVSGGIAWEITSGLLNVWTTFLDGIGAYIQARDVVVRVSVRQILFDYFVLRFNQGHSPGSAWATLTANGDLDPALALIQNAHGIEQLRAWLEEAFLAYRLVGYGDSRRIRQEMGVALANLASGHPPQTRRRETLKVALMIDPARGPIPLIVEITAATRGNATGTVNYTFWWNCDDGGTELGPVKLACGDPTDPAIGAKLDGVDRPTQRVSHTYPLPGTYRVKVLVERGGADPAETRSTVVATAVGQTGSLEVTVATSGENLDPDGYVVTIDGGAGQTIGNSGSVTFAGLNVGEHVVELAGIAGNCAVGGANPRSVTVPASGTTSTTFGVTCVGPATPGTVRWRSEHVAAFRSSPAVGSSGTVYIGSDDGRVYAFDGSTGGEKWRFATGANGVGGPVSGAPALGVDGTVFIGSLDRTLYALDGGLGSKKWELLTLGAGIISAPAIGADGTVFVGTKAGAAGTSIPQGRLYAVDGATGSVKWEFLPQGNSFVPKPSVGSPVIGSDGTVYVHSAFSTYALEGSTGILRWQASLGKLRDGPASALGADGTLYLGGSGVFPHAFAVVYALEPATGQVRWERELRADAWVASSFVIGSNGILYFTTQRHGPDEGIVYAVDAATGTPSWHTPLATCVVATPALGADGFLYVVGCDGVLYALDASTGLERWHLSLAADAGSGVRESSPGIGVDGTIYFGLDNGVVAIATTSGGLATGPWPMLQSDQRHTGRQP